MLVGALQHSRTVIGCDLPQFGHTHAGTVCCFFAGFSLTVHKGIAGEFYPCKPDIFAKTYEPVDDAAKFVGGGQ